MSENILLLTLEALLVGATNIGSTDYLALTMRYSRNSLNTRQHADMYSARTSQRYQFAAPTITNCEGTVNFLFL